MSTEDNNISKEPEHLFSIIEQRYNDAGYKLPRLIFWNLCSRTGTIPKIDNGAILLSGFSQNTMKMALSSEVDPYKMLLEILNSDRYKEVTLKIM